MFSRCGWKRESTAPVLFPVMSEQVTEKQVDNEFQIICPQCDKKTFYIQHHFFLHLDSHRDEKPRPCTFCGKNFKHILSLYVHQRVQCNQTCLDKKIEVYNCPLCENTFSDSTSVNVHVKIHSEIKHKCPEENCKSSFKNERHFRNHKKRTHEGPRECFQCLECETSFSRKQALDRHQRIHTDEKPFKCKFCGYAGKWRSNLQAHNKSFHSAENIKFKFFKLKC